MTRYKENSAVLLSRLGQQLAKYGYRTSRAEPETFTRKHSDGRMDVLHVAFVRHGDVDFDVVLDFALRIAPVEQMIGEITGSDTKDRTTLGNELGNIIDGKQRRWKIVTAGDVESAVAGLIGAAETVLFPYFDRYSDPKEALAALRDAKFGYRHSPFDARRYTRALALAAVLNDTAAMEEIAAEGRAKLSGAHDQDAAKRFDEFATKILMRSR